MRPYIIIVFVLGFFGISFSEISVEEKQRLLNGFVEYLNNLPIPTFAYEDGSMLNAQQAVSMFRIIYWKLCDHQYLEWFCLANYYEGYRYLDLWYRECNYQGSHLTSECYIYRFEDIMSLEIQYELWLWEFIWRIFLVKVNLGSVINLIKIFFKVALSQYLYLHTNNKNIFFDYFLFIFVNNILRNKPPISHLMFITVLNFDTMLKNYLNKTRVLPIRGWQL